MEFDRSSDWMVVRISPADEASELAESIWGRLNAEQVFRVVLDLDQIPILRSRFVGELVRLYKHVRDVQGVLRICGLTEANQMVLRMNRLDSMLRNFPDRETAMSN